MPLPEADAATREHFVRWLERFAGLVRDVDYAAARPLFHPDILAFGTHRDIIDGLASWQATQWRAQGTASRRFSDNASPQ